eukprot:763733-Prorocentrum_minimum.AAC.2
MSPIHFSATSLLFLSHIIGIVHAFPIGRNLTSATVPGLSNPVDDDDAVGGNGIHRTVDLQWWDPQVEEWKVRCWKRVLAMQTCPWTCYKRYEGNTSRMLKAIYSSVSMLLPYPCESIEENIASTYSVSWFFASRLSAALAVLDRASHSTLRRVATGREVSFFTPHQEFMTSD